MKILLWLVVLGDACHVEQHRCGLGIRSFQTQVLLDVVVITFNVHSSSGSQTFRLQMEMDCRNAVSCLLTRLPRFISSHVAWLAEADDCSVGPFNDAFAVRALCP